MAEYSRGMYRQLSEEIEKAEHLEEENHELRIENTKLRKKVESLGERLDAMTVELNARIEAAVNKAVKPMQEEITRANDEIAHLKANRDKDSGNSSKPPSSNGFKKIVNKREGSERKPGGQPGHKGHTISILKNLDELVKQEKRSM